MNGELISYAYKWFTLLNYEEFGLTNVVFAEGLSHTELKSMV